MKPTPLIVIAMLLIACRSNRYSEQRSMVDAPARTSSAVPAEIASSPAADNVKVALINAGANSWQIATTSCAENEVSGVDEADLPAERRIDVLLGN